jgi:hypothetical protein
MAPLSWNWKLEPDVGRLEQPAKLKSVLVIPNGAINEGRHEDAAISQHQDLSPRWQLVKPKRGPRAASHPSSSGTSMRHPATSMRCLVKTPAPPLSSSPLTDLKKAFRGKCFRCLASDHQVAHCWEPRHCLNYWGCGHFTQDCKAPPNHRSNIPKSSIISRLTFPPNSIHSRITFPELSYAAAASFSPATSMAARSDRYVAGNVDQWPSEGRAVVVATGAMSSVLQKLCRKAVVLST